MSEPDLGHPGACLSIEKGGNSIELWKMPQAWVGRDLGCQLKKGVLLFKGQISWLWSGLGLFIHSRNLCKELPYFGIVCLALSLEGHLWGWYSSGTTLCFTLWQVQVAKIQWYGLNILRSIFSINSLTFPIACWCHVYLRLEIILENKAGSIG